MLIRTPLCRSRGFFLAASICFAMGAGPSLFALPSGATLAGPTFSITEFSVPTLRSVPSGITTAAAGSVSFTERTANKVARMTNTGVVTEYAVPTAASGPEAITASPDGYVWFTERYGGKIGRISPASGGIVEFAVVSPVLGRVAPSAITTDSTGTVWFA